MLVTGRSGSRAGFPAGRHQRRRIEVRPHEEDAAGLRRLQQRDVHVRHRRLFDGAIAHVFHDADDFGAIMKPALSEADLLSDRILVAKNRPRRRLVDHDDLGLTLAVAIGERPATQERNANRLEELRRCPVDACQGLLAWRHGRLAGERHVCCVAAAGDGRAEAVRGRLHTGQCVDAIDKSTKKRVARALSYVRGSEIGNVISPAGSNPSGVRCRLFTLCSISPAATSSTSASAVSPTISRLRRLSPRAPGAIDPAPPVFIVVTMSERDACHAGTSPKSTAVSTVMPSVKSSVVTSRSIN